MPTEEMSIEQLEAHLADLKALLEARRKHAITTIRSLAKEAKITVTIDGMPAQAKSSKGTKVPPKFRCPNTGKTWSGRGVRPKWMNGADPEQFRI